MVGITNTTVITLSDIQSISNVTLFTDFAINVNNTIYGGWLYFILLLVLWIITFYAAQQLYNQPLSNGVYTGVVMSIISLLMRIPTVLKSGVVLGLLTDKQMFLFPLVTILLGVIMWLTKE